MSMVATYMLGRCANGHERDKGLLIHAVGGWKALCSREPGRRSAGWADHPDQIAGRTMADVNCPRCRSKLNKLEASQ
jgi:hypothetical protein